MIKVAKYINPYHLVAPFKWSALPIRFKNHVTVYAQHSTKVNGKRTTILMHRLILQGVRQVDHQDGNGLNNRRYNLRPATHSQNQGNAKLRLGCSSKWRGVSRQRSKRSKRLGWAAQISKDRTNHRLGIFREECDAAQAYNFKAEELFGEFANFNVAEEANT